ncbi:DHA2 family metal-tetracycline-proton antiporter-like MFS transporter/DHA2 family florfenicol/chloramphenicol resistance protein-like MFS transporter [Saccharothrix carnea]|uniref:DHA2 family metal-tetracycline-proton antiporter-like MFS transporter/DHA2 family florfenicol/chloramphenicol resistance protein-like MFS transporter n=1 Tax=Saccharothrix carnea TaxID=1280637 RepID=A0A2P8IBH9_SACCR|nr:MFS transporter [Saccharothrix carnea]PSL55807.1 DHA2 family metal-tetracycline-proton antiporter-like MFS transporter/DHA2 family florfenicol/chloramphenicol resistance protein-like MFS transporter [Saccharothrix carnea]
MTSTSTTSERTGPGLALLALVLPAMLATVTASDMVNLMLPAMGTQFGATEAELAWVVTGFLLMFSVGIPLYGRVSDRVSLRRLFVFALLTYAVGSAVCALAPNLFVLVTGRIVTGIGAAAIPVLSIIAVTRLLPAEKRGVGIGVVSAGAGVGTAAGPAVGGLVGQWLGWPALFWIMLVVALVLVPPALRVLPDDSPAGRGPIDIPGGILLGLGAGLVLFGMTQAQVSGFAALSAWGSLLVAVVALVLFAWRTARVDHPFVPPALFANRVYRTGLLVAFLAMVVNLGGLVFVSLLVVEVNGLTPGQGALVMIPAGVAVAALSPLIGRLADRVGTRPLVLAGLTLVGLFSLFLSTFTGGSSPVPAAIGILGLSIGFILVMTTLIGAAAAELPGDQVGVGLGILQGVQFLGAGTGPAVFGVLVSARLESGAGAVNPFYARPEGTAYSDVFLAMAVVIVLTLVVASRMRPSAAPAAATQEAGTVH